ncbi:hypothetical protein EQG41_19380 [Billgrantia azerbaijanica]|nr:hypothetical protein EQG41_19380 [Halomonas azerbaijanica]
MHQFLFPCRPLSRRTLLTSHLLLQLGLLGATLLWLVSRTPWLAATDWPRAWPALVLGGGAWLLAAVALRLLAELWLLPHHLAKRTNASAVVTRSFERRPAVHDTETAWTSQAYHPEVDDSVLGRARVTRPAEPPKPQRRTSEPTLDLTGNHPAEAPSRREPRL